MLRRPLAPIVRPLADAPLPVGSLPGSAAATTVAGVTLDSRDIHPGDLYAALPGTKTHGARFAVGAIDAGAAAVLTDAAGARLIGDTAAPVIVVPDPRGILGRLSAWVYGDPAEDLLIIGVTGTNGKTTLAHLLASGLEGTGHITGVIGTTGIRVGSQTMPSARTTPEAPDVHALLAIMREQGVQAVAMEVSSHALVLGRVDGIVFDVAVFTNLTQDHLDFHGSMAEYFAAKADLFTARRARRAVVCVDDDWGRRLAAGNAIPTTTYGLAGSADWQLAGIRASATGAWQATASGPDGINVPIASGLPGGFNQSNALGALAALAAAGQPPAAAAAGIGSCPWVPGRMEPVAADGFAAFVDYAHTPDAVQRAIEAARGFCTGRVLVALGCGGDRDQGKRPLMGRVAAMGADLLIVTDDNPRSEDPRQIRAQVLAGISGTAARAEVVEMGDRAAAIHELVARAESGDAVLVLGKGHETGQESQGVTTPFDDREVLAEAIRTAGAAR